jgi:hypothetical protein
MLAWKARSESKRADSNMSREQQTSRDSVPVAEVKGCIVKEHVRFLRV